MVVVWLWVGGYGVVVIPVVARLSLSYDAFANLGEAVPSGGVSFQGGCFCVEEVDVVRPPRV
jgi:hypothetical protein